MENVEVVDIQKVKELLESTPYQKLREVLSEQGIVDAWKPGTKKAAIINEALKLYEKTRTALREEAIKKSEEEAKEEESTEAKDSQLEAGDEVIVPSVQVQNPDKLIPEFAKTKLIKKGLSKEVLEKSLKNIEANLRNGAPAQRAILLAKKQEIEYLLKKEED